MWLRDFLEKDLPQCRTLIYGYNAKLHSRGINTLLDYCAELMEELKLIRAAPEESRRPLILLGHSFGGLIIAQTLVKAKQHDRDTNPALACLYDSIIGLMFFATPHRGLLIDDIQAMIGEDTTHPRAALVEQIGYNSQWLAEQLSDFKNVIRERVVVNFIEMQQTRRLVADGNGSWTRSGDFVTALGPDSALLQLPDSMEIKIRADADHSSIVKFDTVFNRTYQRAIKYLRQCEEEAIKKSKRPGNSKLILNMNPLESGKIAQQGIQPTTPGPEAGDSTRLEASKIAPVAFDISAINRVGMTVLYHSPDPIADIVLIPDMTGDPCRTWSCNSDTAPRSQGCVFWPADFLPKDCPTAQILTWGFECPPACEAEAFLDKASDLVRDLTTFRPLGRSLIFIAHSFGGLILKEALLQAEKGDSPALRDIVSYTTGVIYFGTPHRSDGNVSSFHEVIKSAALSIIRTRNLSLSPLGFSRNNSEFYTRLDASKESFVSQWEIYGYRVKAFVEAPRDATTTIVPKSAASFGQLDEDNHGETTNAHHDNFCQFWSTLDPGYLQLKAEFQACLNQIKTRELHLRNDCLRSLNFPELQNREFDITNPVESTATWLFDNQDYLDWSNWDVPHSSSRRGLLWLKGKPGSGKSTLMKESLRRVKSNRLGISSSVCIAGYFFTSRTNVALQKTPLGLFRTLLHDLIQQDRALLCAFISEFKKKNATSPSSWEWHREELQNFFQAAYLGVLPGIRRAILFVDALDECDDNDSYNVARDLVYYFRDITAASKLKICLSSRHYPHIKVPDCPQVIVEKFNSDDVLRFVNTQLSSADSDNRARKLAEKIAAKADGVFLWVILVVKSLNIDLDNERTDADLEETLNTVPKKLEDLFGSLFASTPSVRELQKAAMIFQWVLLAARPLTMNELRHALTVDRDNLSAATNFENWDQSRDCLPADPKLFLTSLRFYTRGLTETVFRTQSPASTPDDRLSLDDPIFDSVHDAYFPSPPLPTTGTVQGYSSVQFIHESVREYFLHGQGFPVLEGWQSHTSIAERHHALAEYCMACIYEFQQPPKRRQEYESDWMRRRYPFIEYATQFLFFHTRHADDRGVLPKTVIEQLVASEGRLWTKWTNLCRVLLLRDVVIDGFAPFHLLCQQQQLLSASFLLKQGVDVNVQDKEGDTALHYSVLEASADAVQFLVENGADIHIRNHSGQLPLHYIGRCKADKNVLYRVFRPFLIDRHSIICADSQGYTPLHEATRLNNLPAVQVLLLHNIPTDLSARDCRGDTTLHLSAGDGVNPKIITELLDAGADPNAQNKLGKTPLHVSSSRKRSKTLQYFLRRGADVNARDRKGRTPLHTVILNTRGIHLLVAAGADINAKMPDGRTPLHFAALRSRLGPFQLLAEAGADLAVVDAKGATPIDVAGHKIARNDEVLQLILSREYLEIDDVNGGTRYMYQSPDSEDPKDYDAAAS